MSKAATRTFPALRVIGDGLAELLWPTRCVLCDKPGTLLCHKCMLDLPYIDILQACPYCGQAHGKLACVDCNSFVVEHRGYHPLDSGREVPGKSTVPLDGGSAGPAAVRSGKVTASCCEVAASVSVRPLDGLASVVSFTGVCRKLVTTFKDRKEVRLASVMASLMVSYIDPGWVTCARGNVALVAIPARKQAIRERGFDHMKEVGKELSRLSGLPLARLLDPNPIERRDQRGLSATSRRRNMQESFVPVWPEECSLRNRSCKQDARLGTQGLSTRAAQQEHLEKRIVALPSHIILIDDVFTTGATLAAAAAVLKQMGVEKVYGLTFGRLL